MRSWTELDRYLGKKNERPSPHSNPRAVRIVRCVSDGAIAVQHHGTPTVVFNRDGTVVLDTHGWRTATTKSHMNEFLPGGLYITQSNWVWHLGGREFLDGTIIFPDGGLLYPNTERPMPPKERDKLYQAIRAYAREFGIRVAATPGPFVPDDGDCLYCRLGNSGLSLGDMQKDTEHLLAHIEEGYYVPSLLYNAMRERKLSPYVAERVSLGGASRLASWDSLVEEQVADTVRQYLRRRLIDGLFDARRGDVE